MTEIGDALQKTLRTQNITSKTVPVIVIGGLWIESEDSILPMAPNSYRMFIDVSESLRDEMSFVIQIEADPSLVGDSQPPKIDIPYDLVQAAWTLRTGETGLAINAELVIHSTPAGGSHGNFSLMRLMSKEHVQALISRRTAPSSDAYRQPGPSTLR